MMKSCFFTGHRKIKNTYKLYLKLINTLETLIEIGVVDFYAGGAMGLIHLRNYAYCNLKINIHILNYI